VLVREIEKSKREGTEVAPQTVPDISIQLEDIIPRFVREISYIALPGPVAFNATEETARMVIERENLALMECCFLAAVWIDQTLERGRRLGDIFEHCLQIRERDLVSRPERPLVPNQL